MATAPQVTDTESTGTRFVAALVRQDWTGVQACFETDAHFRALVPSGLREAENSASAAGHLRRWFGDADQLILLSAKAEEIEGRLSLSYRLHLRQDQWYIVEQRAYCDVVLGNIRCMDLLCSGFRPTYED